LVWPKSLVWPDLLFSDDFVLAGLAVLVAGTVRGFSGFGAGLVMMGPLSIIYGLPGAVVTVAVCDACAALTLLRGVWAMADRKRALAAAISAAILLPLGTYILQVIDAELLQRIAGVLILFFIAFIAAGVRWRGGGVSGSIAVGAIGGLIGGATSLIGPPMVLYMLARDEDAIRTRASLALYISIVVVSQVTLLALFEVSGQLAGWTSWAIAASFIPVYAAGILLGKKFFNLAPAYFYRRLTIFLVALSGLLALAV
jgi:uncharacterized membrane protein YfcA